MSLHKEEIQKGLITILSNQIPPLRIRKNNDEVFEVCGTREAMQGRQKVDGFYFASVVPKPKDIRLYYFPIYTHPEQFKDLSPTLRKMLKGKSCFHLKNLDQILLEEIEKMIQKGISLYLKDELL